jgi:ABC-2 type transport system ATP-binding protein
MWNVGKKFKDFQAVQGLDLAVPQGSLLGVIGPSGCGKTTTIRLMLGVYGPSEGEIRVFGEEPLRFRRATRERIGYLPQHFVLYPTLSVDENLDFAAAVYGLGPVKRRKYKEQALQFVGLAEHRRTLAGDISGGMQRRLELAATLLHQPELLVLDEPTAGIDPILREQFWAEFRRLQRAGRTQIVTTQYVTEAEYCDVVILMDAGTIVAAGAPDDLRRAAAGGELIDASISNLDDRTIDMLRHIPGVREVRRLGDSDVRLVTAGQAGELIPQVAAMLERNNVRVQSIEERRLSFNQVFVALLERAGRDVSQVAESRGGRANGR